MGCLFAKSTEVPAQTPPITRQTVNPIHDPKPGDITKAFNAGDYIKVTELYHSQLPTRQTFSDEDIICVLAVLTVENRLQETADPSWALTKGRRVSESVVKELTYQKMRQMV